MKRDQRDVEMMIFILRMIVVELVNYWLWEVAVNNVCLSLLVKYDDWVKRIIVGIGVVFVVKLWFERV